MHSTKEIDDYLSRIDEVTGAVQSILRGDAAAEPEKASRPLEPKQRYASDYSRFENIDDDEEEKPREGGKSVEEICQQQSKKSHEEGNKLFGEGRFKEALDAYTRAYVLNESNHTLLLNRALAHIKLAMYDEGLKDCDDFIKLKPGNAKAHHRRALCLFELRRVEEALREWEGKCCGLAPRNAEADYHPWIAKCKDEIRKKISEQFSKDSDLPRLCTYVMAMTDDSNVPEDCHSLFAQLYNRITVEKDERSRLCHTLHQVDFPSQVLLVARWGARGLAEGLPGRRAGDTRPPPVEHTRHSVLLTTTRAVQCLNKFAAFGDILSDILAKQGTGISDSLASLNQSCLQHFADSPKSPPEDSLDDDDGVLWPVLHEAVLTVMGYIVKDQKGSKAAAAIGAQWGALVKCFDHWSGNVCGNAAVVMQNTLSSENIKVFETGPENVKRILDAIVRFRKVCSAGSSSRWVNISSAGTTQKNLAVLLAAISRASDTCRDYMRDNSGLSILESVMKSVINPQ